MEKLIIGSRGSKLALKYADIAKKAILKKIDVDIEIKKIITDGDLVLDRRTSEIGGKASLPLSLARPHCCMLPTWQSHFGEAVWITSGI